MNRRNSIRGIAITTGTAVAGVAVAAGLNVTGVLGETATSVEMSEVAATTGTWSGSPIIDCPWPSRGVPAEL